MRPTSSEIDEAIVKAALSHSDRRYPSSKQRDSKSKSKSNLEVNCSFTTRGDKLVVTHVEMVANEQAMA